MAHHKIELHPDELSATLTTLNNWSEGDALPSASELTVHTGPSTGVTASFHAALVHSGSTLAAMTTRVKSTIRTHHKAIVDTVDDLSKHDESNAAAANALLASLAPAATTMHHAKSQPKATATTHTDAAQTDTAHTASDSSAVRASTEF